MQCACKEMKIPSWPVNSTDVKTMRNSNWKDLFVLLMKNGNRQTAIHIIIVYGFEKG